MFLFCCINLYRQTRERRVNHYPLNSRQCDDACAEAIWNRALTTRMFSISGGNNKGGVMSLLAGDVSNDSAEILSVRPDRQNECIDVFSLWNLSLTKNRNYNHKQSIVETMSSLITMSAEEISKLLDEYGIKHGPVVGE